MRSLYYSKFVTSFRLQPVFSADGEAQYQTVDYKMVNRENTFTALLLGNKKAQFVSFHKERLR